MSISFKQWCDENNPSLLGEWDVNKNAPLKPEDVSYGSGNKVWWLCPLGHSYAQTISNRTRGKRCPCCFGKKAIPGISDLKTTDPELARQWHPTKNGSLSPSDVKKNSGRMAWWICPKGHEWQATVCTRSKGHNCPYCSGLKTVSGENDLQTTHPELAKQWHPTKNGSLRPFDVKPGSSKKVWWMCLEGHEWECKIDSRVHGVGCPICSRRELIVGLNDLQSKYPQLALSWHPTKNGNLSPSDVMSGSSKKVWWVCSEGHEWDAAIRERVKGNGCPYCSGRVAIKGKNDLKTINATLASEWHPTKNGSLKPSDIKPNSNRKVWWVCSKGHEWQQTVSVRNTGIGCPYCSNRRVLAGYNDLQTIKPELAKQWHPTLNSLKPTEVTPYTHKKVWWLGNCGHVWYASVASVSKSVRSGCPLCSKELHTSFTEKAVAYYLSKKLEIIENYSPDFLEKKEIDIYIPSLRIGIEYDGQVYHNSVTKDEIKNDLCRSYGVELIRIREPKCPHISGRTIQLSSLSMKSLENGIIELLQLLSDKSDINLNVDVDINRDSTKIMNLQYTKHKEKSIENSYPELAKEWDYSKNDSIPLEFVPSGSDKKVWWKCPEGHEWQASISSRTIGGHGCPFCSGQAVLKGYNDLESTHPIIAAQWHPTRNGNLKPSDFTATSGIKVWWKCPEGHEWQALISNRTKKKYGCPYCSNQKLSPGENDLQTKCPEISEQWNFKKNYPLTPRDFISGSGKTVWWICPLGHEWKNSIVNRTRKGQGCPYCSGRKVLTGFNDLITKCPELEKYWDYERNTQVNPQQVSLHSHKSVFWKCTNGHCWESRIDQMSRKKKCPFCN